MQLELTEEERELLREVLDSALRELRVEVRRTETSDFHDSLAARETKIRELLSRVGGGS